MRTSIRKETASDLAPIHQVNVAAFETTAEANLVDALRVGSALTLSLVAEGDEGIIGHIAFSPVTVTRQDGSLVSGLGLAPMAVVPSLQRAGVGATLVREGLRILTEAGHPFCVVLGHARYYPRFGFVPASRYGMRWERTVPDEAFMVLELTPGGLRGVSGVVRYRPEFEAL